MERRNFFSILVALFSSLLIRPRFAEAVQAGPKAIDCQAAPSESDEFEPIRSPNRFRIVGVEWGPDQLSQHYHDYVSEAAREKTLDDPQVNARAIELLEAYRAARGAYPNPDNLLAIPSQMCGETELDGNAELMTREEAFEIAAQWNQDLLDEFSQRDEERYVSEPWYVVFEYGQTALHDVRVGDVTAFNYDASGWGREQRGAYTELRLVRPTAEEIARYAIPAA
jgi:hypothetical protein